MRSLLAASRRKAGRGSWQAAVDKVTQLAAASYVESVRSDRALRLKLVAFGLLVVGDFAWFLLPPLNQDTWPDVLTIFGIWSAVAVLAWFSPLIGALLLFLGALSLAMFWIAIFWIVGLAASLGEKEAHAGAWAFWTLIWWVVLPMVAARLLIASQWARRELEERQQTTLRQPSNNEPTAWGSTKQWESVP